MTINAMQSAAVANLLSLLSSVRNLTPEHTITSGEGVATVSNYLIKPSSVILLLDAPNFPPIEVKASGMFALPTIKSYDESGNKTQLHTNAFPGHTSRDAALFADKHATKTGRMARAVIPAAPATPSNPAPAFTGFDSIPAIPTAVTVPNARETTSQSEPEPETVNA